MTSSTTRKTTIPASCWRQRSEHDIFQVPPKTAHLAAGRPGPAGSLLDRPGAPGLDERPGAICIRPDPEISGQPVLSGLLLCDGGAVCPGGRPRAGLCGMEHHGGSQGQRAAEAPGLQRGSGGGLRRAERLRRYLPAVGGVLLHGHLPGPVRHPGGGGIAPGSDGGDRVVRGKSGADRRPGAPG